MDQRSTSERIFLAGIERVLPEKLITSVMALSDETLSIDYLTFHLPSIENIYVIGSGKASASMAAEVEKILGFRITDGHISVKYGHSCKLKYITVTEAGHPIPDSNGYKATKEILRIANNASHNDLVICLLSGGGSVLMPDFPEGSSPDDMNKVNHLLIDSGACIQEINAVRKHLSVVKGGQLARAVSPATLVSLILSDVAGNPLDVIASGPTTPDPTTFQQALAVLEKFNITQLVPVQILKYLHEGESRKRPETMKPGDCMFENTFNVIVGTNRIALEAARERAFEFNFNSIIIDDQLQGDTNSVAEYIVETSLIFQKDSNEIKPVCLLFGGETTVKMTGKGKGGRNQHLALQCAALLRDRPGITILCAGTDGTDGPTDAAGAVVDSETAITARSKYLNIEKYISDFDSYSFFKKAGGHVFTGPTMTNVMDIIVVIVEQG
jgi:glycerate 2-kinase